MKYITNSLQKLIIMINWYYNVYLLFCSVKLFSCSRGARADNYDNPTSKTVTRYFVPNKIQIAEIPPNRSIGFIFCPLSARFLKETSINFNETVSDNSCNIIFSLFLFNPWCKSRMQISFYPPLLPVLPERGQTLLIYSFLYFLFSHWICKEIICMHVGYLKIILFYDTNFFSHFFFLYSLIFIFCFVS